MSQLNPYKPPGSADSVTNPVRSRWRYFLIYASVFTAIYTIVVCVVAGVEIMNRFAALSTFERLEYGFQLLDGAGVAILATSPIWLLAHRFQTATPQVLAASLAAMATYLPLFVLCVPKTFTWAVHGVPLGAARPFWTITGGMLLCSMSALCVALPIVAGHKIRLYYSPEEASHVALVFSAQAGCRREKTRRIHGLFAAYRGCLANGFPSICQHHAIRQ